MNKYISIACIIGKIQSINKIFFSLINVLLICLGLLIKILCACIVKCIFGVLPIYFYSKTHIRFDYFYTM